jgi:hypothetical protein
LICLIIFSNEHKILWCVPNNVNLLYVLLWLRESLVVMTRNAKTLLVIALLLNKVNTLTDVSLVTKLLSS